MDAHAGRDRDRFVVLAFAADPIARRSAGRRLARPHPVESAGRPRTHGQSIVAGSWPSPGSWLCCGSSTAPPSCRVPACSTLLNSLVSNRDLHPHQSSVRPGPRLSPGPCVAGPRSFGDRPGSAIVARCGRVRYPARGARGGRRRSPPPLHRRDRAARPDRLDGLIDGAYHAVVRRDRAWLVLIIAVGAAALRGRSRGLASIREDRADRRAGGLLFALLVGLAVAVWLERRRRLWSTGPALLLATVLVLAAGNTLVRADRLRGTVDWRRRWRPHEPSRGSRTTFHRAA